MKRFLLILTVLVMAMCLLAGCKSADDSLNEVTGGLGGSVSVGNGESAGSEGSDETPDNSTQTPDNSGGSDDPDVFEDEVEKDYSDYITVVSYNIKSLQIDKEGVVAALKEMDGDIVGLQEVDN